MTNEYELKIAEFEVQRNEAMDKYFDARKHIERNRFNERIFEAGFRMAWEIQETKVQK